MNTRKPRIEKRIDYTGTVIGYLSAVSVTPEKYGREFLWEWKCVCGKKIVRRPSQIKAGRNKSCGCKQAEMVDKAKRLPAGEAAFRQLFRSYKNGARNRNYSFDLSMEDFRELTKQNCYYCGDTPSLIYSIKANNTKNYVYNGVDRIDNTKGYIKGNVVPCCGTCNRMKMNSIFSDFLSKVEKIYNKHSSTVSLLRSEV